MMVDDSARNVESARRVGMQAVRFTTAEALRRRLEGMGLLAPAG
jgi:2-haloacid dehalogenase